MLSSRWFGLVAMSATCATLVACSGSDNETTATSATAAGSVAPTATVDVTESTSSAAPHTAAAAAPTTAPPVPTTEASGPPQLFDESTIHTIDVEFDKADYDAMLTTFRDDQDKTWIEAEVTIDGVMYKQAGLRLKGNSSLFSAGGQIPGPGGGGPPGGLEELPPECAAAFAEAFGGAGGPGAAGGVQGGLSSSDTAKPETMPWLIRLDKFVEDQNHQGRSDFVVRSNPTKTSLNEAVALDLLETADLASLDAAMTRLTVNGSEPSLRLVIELPNDQWADDTFAKGGRLYKADSQGNWNYDGDDPAKYEQAWSQEGGDDTLKPLIGFLDFVNNSTDAEFSKELPKRLDVEAFARYLAFEELIENFDDIDGPGNNAYLYFAKDTDKATVVAWDHNFAFSGPNGPFGTGGDDGGPPPGLPDFSKIPEQCRPAGFPSGGGGGTGATPGGGGFPGLNRSNVLVNRLKADTQFSALYEQAKLDVQASLSTDKAADAALDKWIGIIDAGASDLADAATVEADAKRIRDTFTAR